MKIATCEILLENRKLTKDIQKLEEKLKISKATERDQ